jgi:hypothetical protein
MNVIRDRFVQHDQLCHVIVRIPALSAVEQVDCRIRAVLVHVSRLLVILGLHRHYEYESLENVIDNDEQTTVYLLRVFVDKIQ